ncbi:MAG: type II toxin-antitoxin system VapC family toxin [Thermomicrobiales bacterium]
MSYLIDTDEVINYLRARQPDATRIGALIETQFQLFISLITYYEIYDGIFRSKNVDRAEAGFLRLLQRVDILSMDEDLMRLAARFRGQLETGGQRIGDADTIIAATAIHLDLTLVTRNARHFERISGLRILSDHMESSSTQ